MPRALSTSRTAVTVQNTKGVQAVQPVTTELLVQQTLAPIKSDRFVLSIYFGRNMAKRYDRLCRALFNHFPAPLLRAEFVRAGQWRLDDLRVIAAHEIPESHREFVIEQAIRFFRRPHASGIERARYDLAILVNPDESEPPSDRKAIQNFVQAARREGFSVELIGRADYHRLAEFDALFIRETTSVNHHTWRFSLRAQSEGLAVIDDPDSILKCANKVFLAEALRGAHIPIPETVIVNRDNYKETLEILGLPCVLKRPDSSFSQGVEKASSREEFKTFADEMLSSSDLLIAQEYNLVIEPEPTQRGKAVVVEMADIDATDIGAEASRLRPIHADPKINNFMIDEDTGYAVSLIDLDTVKPGLVHYDIGDCLRSGCNLMGEDAEQWEMVRFDPELCQAILQGYLSLAKEFLTDNDYDYLYDAIRLIAFELGLRFFTDYLEGNVYFKTGHQKHNLARALVQFKLAESIEYQETAIRAVIREIWSS